MLFANVLFKRFLKGRWVLVFFFSRVDPRTPIAAHGFMRLLPNHRPFWTLRHFGNRADYQRDQSVLYKGNHVWPTE